MEIEILSYSKYKELFRKLAVYYIKELNLTKSKYKLVIITDQSLKKQGSRGLCCQTGEKEITVALYSHLNFSGILYTLAHEMVHVKQIARGQYKGVSMKYGKGVRHYWMGKQVPTKTKYLSRPWEIEAISREGELVESIAKYICKKGNKKA